jgi:hypothetical protein
MTKTLALTPDSKKLASDIKTALEKTIQTETALADAEKEKSDLMARHEPIISFEGGRIQCSHAGVAELLNKLPSLEQEHAKAVKALELVLARAREAGRGLFSPLIAEAIDAGHEVAKPFYPGKEHLARSAAEGGTEVKVLRIALSACLNDGDMHAMNRARMILAGFEQFAEK